MTFINYGKNVGIFHSPHLSRSNMMLLMMLIIENMEVRFNTILK